MELQGNWKIFPFLQNHQKKFILLFKNSAQSQIKTLPWVECFYICQLFRWNKVGSPHYEGYQKASTKLTSPKAVAKLTLTCHKIFSSFSFSVFFSSADQIFLSQNIFFPFNFLALFTSKDQIFVLCTNLTLFPSPNSISSAHQIFSKYSVFLEDEAESI